MCYKLKKFKSTLLEKILDLKILKTSSKYSCNGFCTLFYLEIEHYRTLDALSSMDAKISFVRFSGALEIDDD